VVLHDINKPASSVAHDKSTYFTRTDVGIIPRPLAFPDPCVFLPPYAGYKLFNFDIQCPHPSLEGRGNVVVVGDVITTSVRAFSRGGKRCESGHHEDPILIQIAFQENMAAYTQ